MMNPTLANLGCKHGTEPVPPETDCLMANIDPALEKDVLDLTQRQRILDIHHHREPDYLG